MSIGHASSTPGSFSECPLCGDMIDSAFIENHASLCCDQSDASTSKLHTEARPQQKRSSSASWDFMKRTNSNASNSAGASKRTKIDRSSGRNKSVPTDETDGLATITATSAKPDAEGLSGKSSCTSIQVSLDGPPLAEQVRPRILADCLGQPNVTGEKSVIRMLLEARKIPSMVLWGPPGCGKTTLARIIAHTCKSNNASGEGCVRFVQLSATSSNTAEVKHVIEAAKNELKLRKCQTVLFMDEIHRFNKLQQDTFLPHVESGTIILIGATTENPSFSLNSALLSRCRVIVFDKLDEDSIIEIVKRACKKLDVIIVDGGVPESADEDGPDVVNGIRHLMIERIALEHLCGYSDGDARIALNSLQMALLSVRDTNSPIVTDQIVKDSLKKTHLTYDRKGDGHYDAISALHKSIRGSDDNAAIYWLARMLEGGEDPRFVGRRLIRMAVEDIGMADPNALNIAVSAYHAVQFVGMPEADVALAEAAVYLARANKSVEVYFAYTAAKKNIWSHDGPLPPVPLHLRNAPTGLMKSLNYGKGYKYNPAFANEDDDADQDYLPPELQNVNFFDMGRQMLQKPP